MESQSRVKHVFDGLSLVALGLVFLGNTLGVIEWSVWLNILALWPLLLVSAGVDLVGKSLDSGWVRALSSVVFIGGLAYAVFVMPLGGWPGTLGLDFGRSQLVSFQGAEGTPTGLTEADARIELPAGTLGIRGGAASLVEWSGETRWGKPDVEITEEASSAVVRFTTPNDTRVVLGPTRGQEAEILLNDAVAWRIRLETGASRLDADLSDLRVQRLEVESGVGDGTLRLGQAETGSRVTIKSGVSSLKLLLPQGAEARLRFESGIASRDIPSEFTRRDDGTYETAGYSAGGAVWDIVVQSGIGNLDVQTY